MAEKQNKADRYSWANPGDEGRFALIEIRKLCVDESYQRPEVTVKNTLKIASAFDWSAFGSLVVMERANGRLYVVDGYQRLLAARKRGDIEHVPCVVFNSSGREHEAEAFLRLNVNRRPVSALSKFQAADRAGLSPERDIAEWLKANDYSVGESKQASVISFPAVLKRTWQMDDQACKDAILAQAEIDVGEMLVGIAHKGLYWLAHNGVDVFAHVEKIMQRGGKLGIVREVKRMEIETSLKANIRLCGLAILRMINHGRRRGKITIERLG